MPAEERSGLPPRERPFVRLCGALGVLGCLVAVAADLISWALIPSYSPISQTISQLAVGEGSWLMDLGLHAFAAACLSLAAGMLAWGGVGGSGWKVSAGALILIVGCLELMIFTSEYGGPHNAGPDIHIISFYAFGALVPVALLAPIRTLGSLSRPGRAGSVAAGLAWIVLGAGYFFAPGAILGLYEQLLALVLLAWIVGICALLLRADRIDASGFSVARLAREA